MQQATPVPPHQKQANSPLTCFGCGRAAQTSMVCIAAMLCKNILAMVCVIAVGVAACALSTGTLLLLLLLLCKQGGKLATTTM